MKVTQSLLAALEQQSKLKADYAAQAKRQYLACETANVDVRVRNEVLSIALRQWAEEEILYIRAADEYRRAEHVFFSQPAEEQTTSGQ